MTKIVALVIILLFSFSIVNAQNDKKVLTHDLYPTWKSISNQKVSNDGLWVTYEINPQKGDGFLYLYNTATEKLDSIPRGKNAKISPSSEYMVFAIVPQYDSLRKLKLAKTRKNKLPKDSLGIWHFAQDSITKYSKATRYASTNRGESWVWYVDENKERPQKVEEKSGWWIFGKKDKTPPKKAIKQKGDNVVLLNPENNAIVKFKKADDWDFSYDGKSFFVETISKQDSTNLSTIIRYDLVNNNYDTIINKVGTAGKWGISRDGQQTAFLFAQDTAVKNKIYDLYYWSINNEAKKIADTNSTIMAKNYSPSNNYSPRFSKEGNYLYFGNATKPKQEVKDTTLASEKYHVDIWNYQDKLLQPQQKIQARREKTRTYLAQYDVSKMKLIQLADTVVRYAMTADNDKANYAIGIDDNTYAREQSWDGRYSNYYTININDGSRTKFLDHFQGSINLSPNGNFILYFKDKAWYSYDIAAQTHTNLTENLSVNFYNEKHDMLDEARAYGIQAWYSNDKYAVIADRYDLWKIDPTNQQAPVNITNEYGRKNKIRFSQITYDREKNEYFDQETPHLLNATFELDKSSGYFTIDIDKKADPVQLIHSDHMYYYPLKAKNSDVVLFRRSSLVDYPDLNITNTTFAEFKTISNTNPQQSEYNWGTVELTKWTAYDGQELEGLIYKPENFDSTKQYPMIVYFYELYSDRLHNHHAPRPSHSTVNFVEYASNGYIIFVPDITYKKGHPAASAYNAIVSGTEFMKKNSWVNGSKIALQGQSWGGYQTAMLITMTDIYACAEAGAPVVNMTSAYGGIRWKSGMSRTFQYEKTQSRIGYTLWDSLDLYIENSPLFFADKVNTPLLIMHNDKDGAVPWYQGIEYFTALRRLDKKAWMLTYNNDGHNLMHWPNRVDLSIRMMQFFNHYLKDEPMPEWMDKGLPAKDKGTRNAY